MLHVDVPPVEVAPLHLPAGPASQQEAVCKREGDVRDQDEEQDEGKHRGITEHLMQERERKNLGYPRLGLGHNKG